MSQAEWCTIESDPGVFTELIESFGVTGIQVEELYDLDHIHELDLVYGVIFLFKWQKSPEDSDASMIVDDVPGLFFARQVIQNACATQAIISILLNSPDIMIGEELSQFKEFTAELPPDMRGLSLASSQKIREAHNSFGRPETFELPEPVHDENHEDDAFHFISYIPFQNKLYELDGLKHGPVLIGDIVENGWLNMVVPVIQERIQKYSQTEIRFNLMAVIGNRQKMFEERRSKMQQRRNEALSRLNGTGASADREFFDLPHGKNELTVALAAMDGELEMLNDSIEEERRKRDRWRTENSRRKHNYIPFVFNLLKKLAEKNQLSGLIDKARDKQAERRAASELSKKT